MKHNNMGLWLSVFAGVLFTLAIIVMLNPVSGGDVVHLNDSILASDLNSTNSASDNFVATYDLASGGFTWETVPPGLHVTSHEDGGGDEMNVVGLSGLLADDQHVLDSEVLAVAAALVHVTSHEDGGGDEISVIGLSGLLADDQHVLDSEVDSIVATHTALANAHHNEAHTIASHSDTTGTGAELNTLTDGSETTLHTHAATVGVIFVYKNSDETVNNSSAFQDDNHLTFAVAANGVYAIWGSFKYLASSAGDIKWQWSLPAGATWSGYMNGEKVSKGAESNASYWDFVANASGDGNNEGTTLSGVIIMGGTGGTAALQWAQDVAHESDAKMFIGSWIAYQNMG